MIFHTLDWAGVEGAMRKINLGIEYGVSAECRVQDITGTITLAYAKLRTTKDWGFCDENRIPITKQPERIQRILWKLLPDLLLAMNDEALRIVAELEQATSVLREGLALYDRGKEQEERDSMVGLA